MLEIASQITICLLLAALIGFIMGFIVGRGSKKQAPKQTAETKTVEKTEKTASIEEEVETLIDTIEEESSDEIEIPTSAAIEKVTEALEAVEAQEEGVKPELLTAAKAGKKDALTQIKGIGPKVEEQLNEAGIYHFEQIANWSEENIKWLEKNTTFAHRAKKDLWINQAKALV
jgi:NADH-quinone oxidoreductase subunit E